MYNSERFYAAIRKSVYDNREWIDLTTASYMIEITVEKAGEAEKRLPNWAVQNPMVRVGIMTMKEFNNG